MYYYKTKGSDAYHWHKDCHLVPANVHSNPDWTVSQTKPSGREQCNHCKNKD